jgi:ubiquinone biosynthesis protein UbiJ
VTGRYELRIGADTFAVDGSSGSVRIRRGTADRPDAMVTTDFDTLRAVCLGERSLTDAVRTGDMRLDGDPDAVSRLSDLLLALTPAPGAAALQPSSASGR